MDIAKYIMTVIILSSLFGDVESEILYLVEVVAFIVNLSLGLLHLRLFLKIQEKEKTKKQ